MANPNKPDPKEKEYSPDTIAIIERLKKEGSMIRNGKNSIKAVNINLEKFTNVFHSIDKNVKEMTSIAKWVANRDNNEILANREDEQRKEDLEEITPNKNDDKERDDKGPLKDRLINNAKGLGSLLLTLGKFAFIGFGVFEFLRGFIDKVTGGKMTELIESIKDIDVKSIMTTLESFGGLAAGVAAFGVAIAGFKIAGLFGTLLGVGLPGAAGGGLLGKMGKAVGKGGLVGIAALMFMYGEKITDWIRGDLMNMSDAEIKNTKMEGGGVSGVGTRSLQGVTLGAAIFGLKGALIGGIVGFVFGVGEAALGSLDDKINDLGSLPNDLQAAIALDKKYLETGTGSDEDKARNRARLGKSSRQVANDVLSRTENEVAEFEARMKLQDAQVIELEKNLSSDMNNDQRNNIQNAIRLTKGMAQKSRDMIEVRKRQREETMNFLKNMPEANLMFDQQNEGLGLTYQSPEEKRAENSSRIADMADKRNAGLFEKTFGFNPDSPFINNNSRNEDVTMKNGILTLPSSSLPRSIDDEKRMSNIETVKDNAAVQSGNSSSAPIAISQGGSTNVRHGDQSSNVTNIMLAMTNEGNTYAGTTS